jgi:hypothetical protein
VDVDASQIMSKKDQRGVVEAFKIFNESTPDYVKHRVWNNQTFAFENKVVVVITITSNPIGTLDILKHHNIVQVVGEHWRVF